MTSKAVAIVFNIDYKMQSCYLKKKKIKCILALVCDTEGKDVREFNLPRHGWQGA